MSLFGIRAFQETKIQKAIESNPFGLAYKYVYVQNTIFDISV